MFEIIFKKPAKKFIEKLDKIEQKQIFTKIKQLKNNSQLGKPLIGNLSGLWRLRVNKYRIIYEIKKSELIIYILQIGHRKNIYE
ncbi:MAG TPA: type II toxin-antitoxin system RelE/ParE family toxin [Candidatus Nanoarchaeia archaeon]|nr:type II toxin-antitoxin system RelE/ParE family toxin [Candidatus Nanoarchaeia archaeon]